MPCFYMLLTNVTCVKRCDALWSPWNRPHEAALQAKPGQRVAALLETHVAHIHRGSVQNQLNIGEVQLGCQDERNKTKRKLLASLRTRENGQTFQASCTSSIATKSNQLSTTGTLTVLPKGLNYVLDIVYLNLSIYMYSHDQNIVHSITSYVQRNQRNK